tara:strand:- start:101 stop:487 length:387 start_codon:yes stop_codon:yes gene_type:complete
MSDFSKTLDSLVDTLGEAGVTLLSGQLSDLSSQADEPWQKLVLEMVAQGVESNGMDGIRLAEDALKSLMDNEVPDLSFLDLASASDVLAQLQNAEADRKREARDLAVKAGKTIGAILSGVIRAAITSV